MKNNKVRLPDYIVPLSYDIHLTPDLDAFAFSGTEIVTLDLKKDTSQLTFHAIELDVESAEIIQEKNTSIFAKRISYHEKKETVTFTFPSKIRKGKVKVKIAFRGILNDKMRGFYRSSYVINGEVRYLATTQFESTDARRAFPCIDEPAAKATFSIKLTIPSHLTAISNTMPTDIFEHSAGLKTVSFSPSPKMSTYLAAFIAGELECVEGKTKEGVLVRVFTTPGKKHQAKFALDCAIKTLSYFTEYFGIPYPLPVLDLIAIPDFASGAMENWGAITYRESALLIDEKNSSAANKQWVALVVAHELSHQWFGNLVTMEWWTHLWLNEGFASYIEYLAVDHIFPEWDIWTQFAFSDLGVALRLDGLSNTHAIEINVHHPDEISEIFDAVSYSKGASIIRMLASYLGEKDFRDGLRFYLKKYSYKNTSTEHLWQSLEKVSGKPVEKIMKNWTSKPGYPVVTIKPVKNSSLEISQERFYLSRISKRKERDKTVWSIPTSIASIDKNAKHEYLLTKQKEIVPQISSFYKVNSGEISFFRTQYETSMWNQFEDAIKSKKLPAIDRLGLVRDIFALAEAGRISTDKALEFASYYKNEEDYTVWKEVASGLSKVYNLISNEKYLHRYRTYAAEIFTTIYKKVGWTVRKGESHTEVMLRGLVLSNLAQYKHPDVLKKAKSLFSKVSQTKNPIDPNIRNAIYTAISEIGKAEDYQKLKNLYEHTTLSEEKNRIGGALGNFDNTKLIPHTLTFAVSDMVRFQDAPAIISSVIFNPKGRKLAFQFMKKNWKIFLTRYSGGRGINYLISPLGSFADLTQEKNIESFFKKNSVPGAERTLEQVLEKIESNADWLKRDKIIISNFLKKSRS